MAFISMQPNLGRRSLPTLLALSMIRIKRHLISTFVRWFACSLCLVAMTCQAADAWTIDDIAVLTDPSGIETIEGVSQASRSGEFKPFPHGFSAGYTRSVHWIRFTLQAPPETPQGKRAVLLEIQPAYLDDLTFYLSHPTRKDGSFQVARSGSNEPHSAKAFPYRAFAFLVEFKDAEPRVAYIRVQTVNGAFLTIKAWKPKEFIDQTSLEYMLFGALMGVFLTGLAANVWQGLWRTESLYRCFMGFSISYLTYTLTTNGFVGQFILPDSTGWIKHWFSLGVFTAIIFWHTFLHAGAGHCPCPRVDAVALPHPVADRRSVLAGQLFRPVPRSCQNRAALHCHHIDRWHHPQHSTLETTAQECESAFGGPHVQPGGNPVHHSRLAGLAAGRKLVAVRA
jgi:hypothetical protein